MNLIVYVFNDVNKSGTFESIDIGLSGIYVTLKSNDGTCISQQTNETGYTTFSNLEYGNKYTIYETCENINGNYSEEYFNSFIAQQPKLTNDIWYSTTSTTPRKFIFTANYNASMTVYFGHSIYKKVRCHCKGFLVTNPNNTTYSELIELDIHNGKNQAVAKYPERLNALGYNIKENILYSMTSPSATMTATGLYRIDGDYNISKINTIINSTTNNSWAPVSMSIGSFDNNGIYYIAFINAPSISSRYFYTINLNPTSLNYLYINSMKMLNFGSSSYTNGSYTIADWVFNNTTKKLYSYVDKDLNSYADIDKIIEIDVDLANNTLTGNLLETDITAITDYSSQDSRTMAKIYGYDTGFIYLSSGTGKVYEVNLNDTDIKTLVLISTITPIPTNGDGANCSEAECSYDYGNAPETSELNTASYKSYESSNGPKHAISKDIYIGNIVYSEPDAIIGATVIDNDGISYPLPYINNSSTKYAIDVKCYNNTLYPAKLYAWLDFNTDGIFSLSEASVYDVPSSSTPQIVSVEFTRPTGYSTIYDNTYIRLRLTTEELSLPKNIQGDDEDPRSLTTYTPAIDGEVEDYFLTTAVVPYINFKKSADKESVFPGDLLTYTITLTNNSNTSADNVIFKDVISDKLEFQSGSYINGEEEPIYFSENELTKGINIGTLNPLNGTAIITIITKVK